MPNITNITPPRVPLTDPATGLITREWYKFFLNLFNITGGGTSDTSVTDILNSPSGLTAEAFAEINELYNATLSQPRYELGSGAEFNIIGPPTAGSVAYGTGSAIGFTGVGTAGQYLRSTGSTTPVWAAVSATNLLGGGAGQIPYQSATDVTTFLAPGFDLNVLTYNAATNAPIWTANTGTGNVVRATTPTLSTPIVDTITLGNVSAAGGAKYLVGTYATILGVVNYLNVYGSEFSSGAPVLCYGVRPSSSSDASPSVGTFYSTTSVNLTRGAYTIRGQTHLWWGAAAQTTAVDAAASPALVAQMTLTSAALNLYTGYTYQINGANVLSATTLGSGVVSSSLTSVGTIATGVWQGTAIAAPYGGTGQTVYTVGDILFASTTTALSKLAAGTANRALVSNGAGVAPSYQQISLTAGVSGVLPVANGGTNASTASITSFNNITGYTASGATGTTSTNLVFSTSPTLTTPNATTTIGVGNATASASGCGITFPATQNLSTNANTLDDYIEGTFTGTATGMTTSPTVTVTYVKIGGLVTLSTATTLTGTSNATTFTMTGMPSTLYPSASRVVFVRVQDNGGAATIAVATVSNAGVVSFFTTVGGTAFTASGTKSFYAITFSYVV